MRLVVRRVGELRRVVRSLWKRDATMTKKYSTVRSDLTTTKRAASKKRRQRLKAELKRAQKLWNHWAQKRRDRLVSVESYSIELLARARAEVRAEERAYCLAVCEDYSGGQEAGVEQGAKLCAAALRKPGYLTHLLEPKGDKA